jgi:uncharacterized membrane protein YgcG
MAKWIKKAAVLITAGMIVAACSAGTSGNSNSQPTHSHGAPHHSGGGSSNSGGSSWA